jgi:hypothetical protein
MVVPLRMAQADDVENKVQQAIARLAAELADVPNVRWLLTRGLIHRAVHFATEKPGVEFCALATYLAEMVGHAHKLAHGDNPAAPAHKDMVH